MFFRQIDLTTALRPSLSPDETLLFVQDVVGLYRGKEKIPEYQNGQVYLSSHRVCYVDNEKPRSRSLAIELKDVERLETYAGFLKSSPKVTLYAKIARSSVRQNFSQSQSHNPKTPQRSNSSPQPSRQAPASPAPNNATWVCPICSFSNPVPPDFDPTTANERTPVRPCQACGIKPPFVTVVKAAVAGLSRRPPVATAPLEQVADAINYPDRVSSSSNTVTCPRCTFANHPSLRSCEICGASLPASMLQPPSMAASELQRADSPSPFATTSVAWDEPVNEVRFSFRAGGEKAFSERLQSALTQRKWLLQSAPPVPKLEQQGHDESQSSGAQKKIIGIAGLEQRGLQLRKNNEVVIGNAFEDLEALMASAKEIIALAERMSNQTRLPSADDGSQPATNGSSEASDILSQLNLTTTRDMLSSKSSSKSADLYLTELSRQIAEFLTDDTHAVLKKNGGIVSLVDLWAIFNRARSGVELVSPADFATAIDLFTKLKLPVTSRKFRSGLCVVQDRSRTDERTVQSLLSWLRQGRAEATSTTGTSDDVKTEQTRWGKGVTAAETAEKFGWSVGVAAEELELAEDRGALCREVGLEGVRFWENWFISSSFGGARGSTV